MRRIQVIGRGCQALLAHVLHDTDPRTWAGGLGVHGQVD